MSIIRLRNYNDAEAKVKWSSFTVDVCEHRLKADYCTTLFMFTDQIEVLSVPWGVEVMISNSGAEWNTLQPAAPVGRLEAD